MPVRPILPSDVGQVRVRGASRAATRRPTTTGKIEWFHRTLRTEFLTGRVLDDLATAQRAQPVGRELTIERPHSALDMATPASRFSAPETGRPAEVSTLLGERADDDWISAQDHDQPDHLGRVAGDQLRQPPSRPTGGHPPSAPDDPDLGR